MSKEFYAQVAKVQQKLNAPKSQYNSFGKYNYRNCEDILEALKPLLGDLVVTVSDDIAMVADRIYVKATARITDGESSIENTAFAREAQNKKGMDDSQITGSTSSYARKYALNGLFLIDDNKDADSMDSSHQKPDLDKVAKVYWSLPQEQKTANWPTYSKEEQDAIIAAQPKG